MQKITSKTSGKVYYLPTIDEITSADEDSCGFCLACGELAECVEPDARGYDCECCGAPRVYGAMEFAMRGWIAGGSHV